MPSCLCWARLWALVVGIVAVGELTAKVSYIVDSAEGPEKAKWAEDVLEFADPFIGSGGTGHTTPAAAYPFGMVQPGPDTSHSGWEHCSAYQYGDKRIRRFSQNHLSGTGCSEFTDLGFMPSADDPDDALRRDYSASFDKATEKASPGYYTATLECGTKVEATCTRHVSLFRFTFPKGKKASLLFDPSWSFSRTKSAEIATMKDRRVSGHVDRHGWPGHEYWFAWEVSAEPTSARVVREARAEKGRVPICAYEFDADKDNVIYLKVALSRTSAKGARRNIDKEVPGWDFDGVLAANRAAWRRILERVKAKGTRDQLKTLYTSLYHLCFQPNTISDVDEPDLYSTFSCWDTYRAAGPLYTILTPEYVPAFINSMLWHFEKNGHLPVWTLWGKDNQCMVGVHSVPMIVDAYMKGFKGACGCSRSVGCLEDVGTCSVTEVVDDDLVGSDETADGLRGTSSSTSTATIPATSSRTNRCRGCSKTATTMPALTGWPRSSAAGKRTRSSSLSVLAPGRSATTRRPASYAPATRRADGANRLIPTESTAKAITTTRRATHSTGTGMSCRILTFSSNCLAARTPRSRGFTGFSTKTPASSPMRRRM